MRHILVALAIAGAALVAAPAMASTPSSVTVGPTRVDFLGEDLAKPVTVSITIAGGEPGTVNLQMYDAVIDPLGGWRSVAYGSTESTLDGVLMIEPSSFSYSPGDEPQGFEATLSVDPSLVGAPLLGSLRVSVTPGAGQTGVSQVGAVEVQVLAAPSGTTLEDLPTATAQLVLEGLVIRQMSPWTPVDRAFPDLPWIVNHGPVFVSALGQNTGSLVLDSRVTYAFTRLSPLAVATGSGGPPVFKVDNRPRYVLAGAPFTDTTTSLIPVDGSPSIDSLPFIGFVRVSATVTGELVGIEAEPVTISKTILVFPWKESLFLFVVWLFQREWRHRKGRKVHSGDAPPTPTFRTRIREWLRKILHARPSART